MCLKQSFTHNLEQLANLVLSHGRGNWFFHRPEFLKALYDAFTEHDRSCIKTGKEVNGISSTTHGIIAQCSDGTTESGSIIIGADGTHSTVRSIMAARALEGGRDETTSGENSFLATYRALWGTIPMIEGMEPNEAWDCHGFGSSSQVFFGRGRGWFVIYEKLETPTRESRMYTRRDMDNYAENLENLPMTDKLSVRDVYAASHSCGMSDLVEGLSKTWSWNRTVLIGDAVNAQTPVLGLGFNSGVQDVVALTNALQRVVLQRDGEEVETEVIQKVFEDYEALRRRDASYSFQKSARETRLHAWNTKASRLLDRYIIPATRSSRKIYDGTIGLIVSRGLSLDFAEEKDPQDGRLPWVNQ